MFDEEKPEKFVIKIQRIGPWLKEKLKKFRERWKQPGRKQFLRMSGLTLLVLFVLALGTGIGVYRAILQNLPDIATLEKYKPSIITYLYADTGEVIGEYAFQKRIEVTYEQLPQYLIDAIIATEDPRFYKHNGIDFLGILRAVKEDIKLIFTPRKLHGGSTISQQLITGLMLHRRQTLRRKLKEVILALKLERKYSKEEILTMYCNQFNLGHGAYGVEAASQLYYDKPVSELTLPEAAMIAGIFRSPANYSPYRYYDLTLRRRNHVLNRMREIGYLSQEEAEELKQTELGIYPLHRSDSEFAAYFREEIRRYLYRYYGEDALYGRGLRVYTTLDPRLQRYAEQAVRNQLRVLDKRQGWRDDKENVLEKGIEDLSSLEDPLEFKKEKRYLKGWNKPALVENDLVEAVVTGVESGKAEIRFQEYSGRLSNQNIAWTGTRNLDRLLDPGDIIDVKIKSVSEEEGTFTAELDQEPVLNGSMLAIDPHSGQVRVMVGGYSFQRSEWNNATQAMRQVGSVIKPFLYTAGLEYGLTPASTFIDEPTEFEDEWSGKIWDPPNYDMMFKGRMTLRRGIEESRNIITAKLLDHISPQLGVEYCKKFGITSSIYPYLSLSLGAFEVTLIEMVSAFTTFPNHGVRIKPYFIKRIEDREGNILEENQHESEEVISPQIAYMMTSLLQGVVQRGTAQIARGLELPLAGKTGTTDDHTDAWFIGFSPELCAGVWVGHPEGKITIGPRQSGAVAALPAWIEFFSHIIEDAKAAAEENDMEWEPPEFYVPSGLSFLNVDYKTGLLPTPVCSPQYIFKEVFLPGTEPNRFCSHEDHMMTYDYYDVVKNEK
jgi:penicillin-binding protein 1A